MEELVHHYEVKCCKALSLQVCEAQSSDLRLFLRKKYEMLLCMLGMLCNNNCLSPEVLEAQ